MGEFEATGLSESDARAVRAELSRLLESAVFRTSKRCREFLKYVVEHTIRGQSDNLKERSIGVELFHLPPDFDTGQHTVVRVTANALRKKLAQHYLAEDAASQPVRIELPPGSYSAEFKWRSPAAGESPAQPRTRWRLGLMSACAASLLIIAGSFWVWRGRPGQPEVALKADAGAVAQPAAAARAGDEEIRIAVGSTSPYLDRNSRTWDSDRFFAGGSVLVRPDQRILRTLDPDIYRRHRHGDFRYDIPLQPGTYELRLHFAETGLADFMSAGSSGEGQRIFRVIANGKVILDMFDIVADAAGADIADERVFRDISPAADGFLHLNFASFRGTAILSGIEVLPVQPGKVRAVRIRAGWPTSWQDSSGQQWQSDTYFSGGNALVRTTSPARESDSPDIGLYTSERWGHFSYAVPVAAGRYRVTLRFCESHYGPRNTGVGGLGSRIFDVYCNGVALLRNFDIVREAGGEGLPLNQTFSGIHPTAQGKIVLTFVPVTGMACVNGIEVVEDME